MTDTISYHERHHGYMTAVAAALEAAGFVNDGGNADPNDPRDGFIDLDLDKLPRREDGDVPWPSDQQVGVCWQEERGWWILTVTDTTSSNGRYVYELDVATIAAPSTVARAVAEKAGVTVDVADDEYPDADFPGHQFDDHQFTDGVDPAFEAALDRYNT